MSNPLSFPPAVKRTFLGGIDPGQIWELLENHFADTGGEDGSPYRRQYEQLLARFPDNMMLANHVGGLIGHDGPPGVPDDELHQLSESLAGAYALGIAVGLLLRREAFERGPR